MRRVSSLRTCCRWRSSGRGVGQSPLVEGDVVAFHRLQDGKNVRVKEWLLAEHRDRPPRLSAPHPEDGL